MGILTLNWKESGYKDITTEIGQTITALQRKGAEVDISWTPGHASIAGNEIADALVKEAAMVAMIQPEGRNSSTILENKEANKKTQISKWQSRWDNTEYGRAYQLPYASLKSGLQEVSGYPQQEKLLPNPTNTDRIFET